MQIERKVNELLLTLYAQRLGVDVLFGHEAKVDSFVKKANGKETIRWHNYHLQYTKQLNRTEHPAGT